MRSGTNNARQSRILASDARTAALAIRNAAARTTVLLIRAHAPCSVVAPCPTKVWHAYVFAEIARAKSKQGASPKDVHLVLLDAVGCALDAPDAVVLARYTANDEPVAHEVLTACEDDARPVHTDSRHRCDIDCSVSSQNGKSNRGIGSSFMVL